MPYDELIQQDPLVQYIRKQAEALNDLVGPQASESVKSYHDVLSEMFENKPTRPKWTEKDVEKLPDWK